eukprot:TRINITY_DN37669_c0_g1_i1.p1 TRINITY_DN37669_c0_g1~~TRINITY_DN37669_c0_g1_i1.p1  ORF type:complete len:368 (-),score=96.00 TRINITY_DN37669_c0_g1_i1:72-1175(-)
MPDPGSLLTAVEGEVLVEPAFRRLLSALESEKDRLRGTSQQLEQEREATVSELARIKQQSDEWCLRETQKVETHWEQLKRTNDRLSQFFPENAGFPIDIKCSGRFFTLSQTLLDGVKGSALAQMFSPEFEARIPRDSEGRYLLDFNPECFELIVQYMQNKRLRADAPVPIVPKEQQKSMELLAEELRIPAFLTPNQMAQVHCTSLQVNGNIVLATHPGWQVVTSQRPLSNAKASYVEMRVLSNQDPKGGLALGLCGYIPKGDQVHTIALPGAVLFISGHGLMGDVCETEEDGKIAGMPASDLLHAGSVFGIGYDPATRHITWFLNGSRVGDTRIRDDCADKMKTTYLAVGMFCPDQKLDINFDKKGP